MRTNILQAKKALLALFAMLMPLVASAHDFEVDGIYYNITSEENKTVEVTFRGDDRDSYANEYAGSITLPVTVTHNGVEYSVTSIGGYAFQSCSSLTAITIPEGVTSIGENVFYACKSLTEVHISSIEAWCKISFEGYFSNPLNNAHNLYLNGELVTELVIPESVTSIGNYAFSGCSSLTAITIPASVTSIGVSAFEDCSSLKTVINYSDLYIRKGSSSNGYVAYYADIAVNVDEFISDYAFKTTDGVHYLTGYVGNNTELTLPTDYQGNIYQIGDYAFYGCSSLTAITIPEGVTSIGESAFRECSSLTAITIPEGVTSIGNYAFYDCSSLTSINIPASVTSIGDYAFRGSKSLTAINIPASVTSIGEGAFYGCSSLTDITIPEGVTSIGPYAFDGCSSLTAITIPEGVTSIGGSAFSGCRSLTAITIPEGVTSIGYYAFSGCGSLTAITIPEGVTSIGGSAFSGCSSLKTVINYSDLDIRKGSSDYGYVAFYADKVINIDEVIDGYAFKTTGGVHYLTGYVGNNTELTLPTDYQGNIYQIRDYAFYNCSSLTTITIPEGVTSIGRSVFYDCSSLESLHIGPNVESYGSAAFEGCTAIKELTVMGSIMPEIPSEKLTSITLHSPIPLETKEFAAMVYRNATLNIPEGSLTRYQNADVWKNFWYVNEFDPKKGKAVFLTINQADNGYVKQHMTEGTVCTFTIVAAEGWKIHTVTFNGEDVTSQLEEGSIYTTPEMLEDAVLNIAYEQEVPESVENAHARAIKVRGLDNTIHISGLAEGTTVTLYTTDGTMVAHQQSSAGEAKFTVDTNQVYLVHIGDKVVKIGM